MSRNRNIIFLAGACLVLGMISVSALAQGKNTDTATTQLAYSQVFTESARTRGIARSRHRRDINGAGYADAIQHLGLQRSRAEACASISCRGTGKCLVMTPPIHNHWVILNPRAPFIW